MLVLFSAIFSGLNITIMALDLNDLKRKVKLGNAQAKRVLPLGKRLHLTMSAILLSNIATVSATSLVLDQRLNGWLAGAVSTLLIVVFGEVFPQALFAKNPLAWTSAFAPLLKASVAVTYFVSKPLQILLDKLFPHHGSALQSREELGLLVSEHLGNKSSELDEDEIEIMRGALVLSEKRVRDIMTDIRHTYWLTLSTPLDEAKIDEIKEKAYSRIPVFNKTLTKCYGILLMKDLIDVDFDAQRPAGGRHAPAPRPAGRLHDGARHHVPQIHIRRHAPDTHRKGRPDNRHSHHRGPAGRDSRPRDRRRDGPPEGGQTAG